MPFSQSLRWAVILTLLLGLLAPSALVLVYDFQATRTAVMDNLKRDLDRSTQVLRLSLAEPIWQVSPDLAQPMVNAQFDDERFIAVVVSETNNTKPFVQESRPNPAPELALTQTAPIEREGRQIGQLSVTMSGAPLLARAQKDLYAGAGRTLLVAALSMALILWLLRRRVLGPMERLSKVAFELGSGQMSKPVEVEGNDEIARVGQAMERMRLALLEAFERLRQHANTLEDQVSQRTVELTKTNTELTRAMQQLKNAQKELVESEKLASLGRLVAGVAHELNTPLGNAMTVVTALEDRWGELDAALKSSQPLRRSQLEGLVTDTRRGQDILQRNVRKAAELVRDFKQVAIDQTSDARREFDLAGMVKDVMVMVEPRFKHTPFIIDTQLTEGLKMNSFPGSLGQVLTNLLINALVHGFHDRTEGRVLVTCQAATDNPDWVELTVKDNGWGMDENVRKRIFDPFFTTKLGRGGTGLGMHIVHNIVTQLLGGFIDVISEPGQGALMRLRLPTQAPEMSEHEEAGAGV
ncbi:signal transduction histidine kinase [Inhella inkyongensis]|uniref:histidine kinase n=1 Tax=Inhella inkyongensis TaxID=392593 RepID=A0A840SAT6_9BURK|nr:HAMP domain-containing sensor histidine kinase [Inhella inkyongensis]MBB5206126.1 signal transduction histidine kinase [Inhella inkyongensis]